MADDQGPETPTTGFKGKGIGVDETSIAFRPKNWEEIWNFAQLIAKTEFVPKHFQANPGAILAAIQTGHELGLPPMASLQSIAVINGRPTVWGDGALALLQHDRNFEWIQELPPHLCEEQQQGHCIIKMRGQEPVERKFTKAMAERAKLLTKEGPWQSYQGRMYQMRARGWCIRDAAPGALKGLSIREEAEDIELEPQREPPIALPQAKQEKPPAPSPAAEPEQKATDGKSESEKDAERPKQPGAKDKVEAAADELLNLIKEPSPPPRTLSLKDDLLKWIKEASNEDFASKDPKVCYLRKVLVDEKLLKELKVDHAKKIDERQDVLVAYKAEAAKRGIKLGA